ncbi:aprataxin and PNK-like factor isoform X3 [Acanthopagrus latus]|uniref:aprataxin and PNK-like factor isoform X3 n=1 Tax=Acanthopagrus latus TaxID=8177 RepID=UPI00187C55FB|nr:aprataxin and PNK-like factor isoform X3 [Acanthopagrus latus]
MSGFDLVPVDGGDPIHLPPGETVLGRGPLLGVSDKRVSRHHGLLENLDGRLRLKPTHLNPCFFQSSPTDDPRPLQKDSWCPLRHGDLFSLLPGQHVYKVVAVGGEDGTPRNSQMFEEEEEEEEEELPVSPKPEVEPPSPVGPDRGLTPPHQEATLAAVSKQEEADSPDRTLNKGNSAQPKEAGHHRSVVTPPAPKRRVLPAWMMAAVAAPSASSSSPKVQSAVKGSKRPAAAPTSTKRAAGKQAKTSSPDEEEEEEEEKPKKRRRMISDEEDAAPSKTDVPSVRLQSKSSRCDVSDESETMEVGEERSGGESSTAAVNASTRTHEACQPRLDPLCPNLDSERRVRTGRTATGRTRSISRSAVTPVTPTTRRRRRRRRKRRQTDPSAPTAPTATGKILFTGKNSNTQRNQPPPDVPPRKRPPLTMKMKMNTRTASSMTTARTQAMTQTTPLLTQRTAGRRTSKDCRRRRRPF